MKRMTISRSSVLLLGLALAAPAGAAAQETGQRPQRHIVQEGETLWMIAQMYMGDPFLWPEIYRINTLVVEDPHWIFPGEELRLMPPDTTAVAVEPPREIEPAGPVGGADQGQQRETPPVEAPAVELPPAAPPPPPPATETGPTVFARQARGGADRTLLPFSSSLPARPVRRGHFYAAGFLTEGEDLPWGRVEGTVRDGEIVSGRTAVSSATLFERIRVEAPDGATYRVGDSLLTVRLSREVPGWGRVVVPTGIARVLHATGRDVLAEVVTQFSRVTDGQSVMPLEPFRNPGPVRPEPVTEGLAGEVITVRDLHPVPGQQDIVFVDVGRQDGIVPGDVFEIVREASEDLSDRPPDRIAVIQIVHVRDRSASGLLMLINGPGTGEGRMVRLVAKMPS